MIRDQRITAVIPAQDEALAIAAVIDELKTLKNQQGPLIDHIIVVDNRSRDDTGNIARSLGVTVIKEPFPGYGSACMAGVLAIEETSIVLFVDGDHSCDPNDVLPICTALTKGADLVIGSRTLGHIERDAMTRLQRFGTAIVCRLIQTRFNKQVTDLGPLRAIRYHTLMQLDMRDRRFGWTAEMQVKAFQKKLKIQEVPVNFRVRVGRSKISGTWRGAILAAHDLLRAALFN